MSGPSEPRQAIHDVDMENERSVSADAKPTGEKRGTGPIRICLLGSQGAGKTCLLAGLAILGEPDRASPFQVTGSNPESQSYLNELARSLRSQEWPPPTNWTRQLRLDIRFRGRWMLLHVVDYLGEHFQTAMTELEYDKVQELREHMIRADVLLLLVDPLTDLLARRVQELPEAATGSQDGQAQVPLSPADQEQLLARLSALQNSLAEIFKERIATRPPRQGNPLPDTAILLTKSDQVPELRAGQNPERYLKRQAPAFFERLKGWAGRMRCFSVSVPGFLMQPRERPAADPALSMPPPPGDLHPTGYEELFDWIVRSRERSKRRPMLRRIALVGVPALVLAVLGIGAPLYEQSFQRQQRQAVEQSVSREIDKVEDRLAAATSSAELDDILIRLKELENTARDSRGVKASVDSLSSRATRKKEELRFNQVQDARNAQDRERYAKLAHGFLEEFSTGDRARQVRTWLAEGREKDRQEDREQIRAMRCTGPQTLLEKASRIEAYVRRYPEDPDLQDMGKAARLARGLADLRTHKVRLRSAGLFVKKRKFAVVVEQNQEESQRFASEESTRAKTWDRASFQLEWKPGDRVRVRLEDLYLRDETVASIEEQGPLSLRLLSGKQILEKIEPGWEADFQDEPYVHFELEGFTGDDWELLHRYVHPGDQW